MKTKIRVSILVIIISCFGNSINAQVIQRSIYGNGGNAIHSGSVTLSQTIGEPISLVFEREDNTTQSLIFLKQGFEQNIRDTVIYTFLHNNLNISLNIYPNPTIDMLNIVFDLPLTQSISLQIYDDIGRNVNSETILYQSNSIDVSALVSGIYFIQLEDKQTKLFTTFPFIKL